MPGSPHENGEVPVAHLIGCHLKSIHPNTMHGAFIIAARLTTHQEISGGNHHADWFGDCFGSLIGEGSTRRIGRWNHGTDFSLLPFRDEGAFYNNPAKGGEGVHGNAQ